MPKHGPAAPLAWSAGSKLCLAYMCLIAMVAASALIGTVLTTALQMAGVPRTACDGFYERVPSNIVANVWGHMSNTGKILHMGIDVAGAIEAAISGEYYPWQEMLYCNAKYVGSPMYIVAGLAAGYVAGNMLLPAVLQFVQRAHDD